MTRGWLVNPMRQFELRRKKELDPTAAVACVAHINLATSTIPSLVAHQMELIQLGDVWT